MPRGGNQGINHSALIACIRDYLAVQGAWQMKVLGGMGQRPGIPDVLACLRGRLIAVEVKTGAAVLSAAQQRERGALERAGALYIEARRIEDVEDLLVAAGLVMPSLMRYGS